MNPTLLKRLRSFILFWGGFCILANALNGGSGNIAVLISCVAGCLFAAVRLEQKHAAGGALLLAAASLAMNSVTGFLVAGAMGYIAFARVSAS